MSAESDGAVGLIAAISSLNTGINDIIRQARQLLKDNTVSNFVDDKVGILWGLTGLYKTCFERLEVPNREGFERKLRRHFSNTAIQDNFEELNDLEPEIDRLNGQIVVVSFGVREGALKWMEETGCRYYMYLDAKREIYQSMGLARSLLKTWGTVPLTYYAEQLRAGKKLPSVQAGIKDDPNQMGGDLILNRKGKVAYLYCSKVSSDRPTVEAILDVLKECNNDTTSEDVTISPS